MSIFLIILEVYFSLTLGIAGIAKMEKSSMLLDMNSLKYPVPKTTLSLVTTAPTRTPHSLTYLKSTNNEKLYGQEFILPICIKLSTKQAVSGVIGRVPVVCGVGRLDILPQYPVRSH